MPTFLVTGFETDQDDSVDTRYVIHLERYHLFNQDERGFSPCTFFAPKTTEHLLVPPWAELESVLARVPEGVPWFVGGDFNCLLSVDEKNCGLPYPHRKTTPFRACISMCDLVEASSYGSCFTWWNGRRGESTIWMRLDRYLYTLVWESIFRIFVRHLSKATFDHSLLLISCELISPHVAPKHFVFLNVWTKHDDFFRVVQDSWIEPIDGAPMFVLAIKVLGVWSKGTFGDIFVKLKECEDKVQALEGILQ
nr:uncharacterized protein LOC109164037 [Ipomoea batatas]